MISDRWRRLFPSPPQHAACQHCPDPDLQAAKQDAEERDQRLAELVADTALDHYIAAHPDGRSHE